MSKSQSRDRTKQLGDIFVSVTGGESVTEQQDDGPSDRELRPDDEFDGEDVADGLEDAVAGAEMGDTSDPADLGDD
ncbi:hypothetical protein ACFQGE_00795 [Halomicroarcula sp. GCM10025817]|uniref:hypothetical protein n=1 Tax=Haloarcula TaxID=2237 RepID=UPI0023E84E03|nr:hypothetical protein [Halomicroarcula sp. SYNS111]